MSLDRCNDAPMTLAVTEFLEDLCHGLPVYMAGRWNRSELMYQRIHKRVLSLTCSHYQHFHPVFVRRHPHHVTAAHIDALVNAIVLPINLTHNLTHRLKRISWVRVNPRWMDASGQDVGGHAIMMMFDAQRMTQVVYDPHWHNNAWSVAEALCRRQFHPDYTNLPAHLCRPLANEQSLQDELQAVMHSDERGMCGILTILVQVVCARFNYYNPMHVSRILKRYMAGHGGAGITPAERVRRNQLANQLISWYMRLIQYRNDTTRFQTLIFRNASNGLCRVFSPSTRRLCRRRVCGQAHGAGINDRCMCWQHRGLIRNRDGPNRRCTTPQAPCV